MPDRRLPTIAVLATGGTIAGAQSAHASHAYRAGALSVEHLLAAVPGLAQLARIQAGQVASVGSQNMTHAVWAALAQRVDVLCQEASVDGIVVTHGTDTLEETAYFLSLVTRHDKPVVLVGAMRPATAPGADGPANLFHAVALAGCPAARGRGPLVVMNEDIHYAREVQKMACAGVAAFASPNRGRAGVMRAAQAHFFSRNDTVHTRDSIFSLQALEAAGWPRVDVVHAGVGLGDDLIDFLAARASGLVLAGVGDGNATDGALAALQRASAAGVAVVRASRTGSGRVGRNVEVDDDAAGFIAAGELSPQKARILLMLGLSISRDPARLQEFFNQY
ncbi:asparaginase [Bordetella petrii]|uniref:asparaginase n=1 Tax=Bordetella petrii TaxID=94624 RepID=UPI001E4BA5DB|nr:asparaginase [Bordetella petrii]MCD0501560.1 asparaginase [Bordetella petrii]